MELITTIRARAASLHRRQLLGMGLIFLFGVCTAFWIRFVLVEDKTTHYHANFAVYVNGTREMFDSPTFYEEVASCSISTANPKALVHMHDNVPHVVHAHHDSVTWGLFFENISYSVSRESLLTDDGLFVDGDSGSTLTYMLNGKVVPDIAGRVIGSEDVLLVDYGVSTPEQIAARYNEITRDAGEYNRRNDPSSCTGSKEETFKHRFQRTLGVE